ncbi:hypothetical protein AHMF7616_00978 [Adhaeribacter pallidiroseus]|uniref:Uncharacterized protein n=1 Tax=Adhaeribacter pallidiroseus TaxID=2072847 RepID=A0A369QFQ5_9BACT|nr:hypothetical protein AHMF7616_00978 [Adhaeribacter pallidiroseus]
MSDPNTFIFKIFELAILFQKYLQARLYPAINPMKLEEPDSPAYFNLVIFLNFISYNPF